jgi:hypothetical protein
MTLLLAAFWLAAAPAAAPTQVVFEQTSTTMVNGKTPSTVKSRVFWSGNKVRLEAGDAFEPLVIILDLDGDRGYRLDPAARTAILLDIDALRSRSHLGFALAGDAVNAAEPESFRTRELPEQRTIAGQACHGYRIRNGQTQLDVWMTDQVPIGMDAFARFLEWSGADQSLPGLLPELRKLSGFPMETSSRVVVEGRVYTTRAAVTSVKVGPVEAALFEVPASFKIEDESAPAPAPVR